MFDQQILPRQSQSLSNTYAGKSKIAKRSPSGKEVFICPEESNFYSQCLELFVLNNCASNEEVIEFGSGDGIPVINALLRTEFKGFIQGFEINKTACKIANQKIEASQLTEQYIVHDSCFFSSYIPTARYLISNPPYLPSLDNDLYMPLLHGGTDGSTITKQLLSLEYENVMLMISSYSNPVDTIKYALEQDYYVSKFLVLPLEFGYYSSEPKVRNTIAKLRENNLAFYSKNIYLLAGVLFQKKQAATVDLSKEFLQLITCL
jgi:methylase of polypeptide subunit release factors